MIDIVDYRAGAPGISNPCNPDSLPGYVSRQRPLHRQRQRQALRPNRSRPHRRMSAAFFGVFSLLPSVQRATVTYTRFRLCITSWPCACGRTCNVMLRWQDRRAILLCRDPLLQAAEGIRQSIASGNQAVIPGLVDTLLSASRPFDERQIGGGPWQVRPKLSFMPNQSMPDQRCSSLSITLKRHSDAAVDVVLLSAHAALVGGLVQGPTAVAGLDRTHRPGQVQE